MAADERRYAGYRRDAPRGADARGYAGDNRRCDWPARAQWGTGCNDSASACRVVDAHDRSGAEYGRQPQKRPRGSGDLPQPVHFVSAAGSAVSSRREPPENSRKPPGACDSARPPPPQPGSLASNTVVANMMKRMNYKEGAGLGKNGQGIIAPIEVAFRPKNAGLGTAEGSTGGQDAETPPSARNWPKWDDATGGAKKRGRGFTGPERHGKRDHELDERILAARPPEESAAEAVARVQKAVARAARWSTGQGDLCYGEETAAIAKTMEWVQEETASGTLTADDLVREFTALKEKHPGAYTTYRLADAARAVVATLLRPVFRRWDQLEDPSRGLRAVTALRGVLLDDDGSSSAASPYAALVDDVVVAEAVRSLAAEAWDARDHKPMVRFLETWGGALPLPAIQLLLERVVMPKLAAAVEAWEPRWDPVPCHAWVRPWVPLLGRRWLEQQVFPAVRRKLGEALVGWHAARALADYGMVSPWKEAFEPAAWEEFVEGSVVPYLRQGLRALQVAPPRLEGDGFGAVMRWAPSVVPAREMARLLDEELFGGWRVALCRWLRVERPTVREAVAWHEGWKRLLTPELLADERVSVPLQAGLDMISRSAQGLENNWPGRHGGQHAGEVHSCRYRSRRRAVAGCGNNKRF